MVSNLGINNFEDPAGVPSECFRVTKPGGRIALTSNINGHMGEFYSVFREVLQELGNDYDLQRLDVNENHRGTKNSVSSLLEGAGFRVTKAIEDSFTMRYIDGTALLNHRLTTVGFLEGWKRVV